MLNLKDALNHVIGGGDLSGDTLRLLIGTVLDGEAAEQHQALQLGALLVALRMKGETVDEIVGAAQAMRQRMLRIAIERRPLIDTCGTGGSGLGTFNISTAVAFVCAAAGVAVAKHGNRAITSKSGSADVLAALGIALDASPTRLAQCIEDPNTGLAFLFAPHHHAAMRHVASVRKGLGVRTLFNILGPLTNPAGAERQLLGVFSIDYIDTIAAALGELGSTFAWVVHGADGADELTLSGDNHIAEWDKAHGGVRRLTINARDLGLTPAPIEALVGGTPEENAVRMRTILGGKEKGPIEDAVILNSAAGLVVAGAVGAMEEGIKRANSLLRAGTPLQHLDRLVEATRAHS